MPCAPDPDMMGVLFGQKRWVLGRWSLRMDDQRRKRAWVKMKVLYPFIEATKVVHLPTSPLRIAYFPSTMIDGTVGLPIPVLMRIP